MRILIISDTHRYHEPLEGILKNDGPFDLMIHCGDLEGEEDQIERLTGPTCACVMVPGNNDFFCTLPRERVLKIAGLSIWITHGHNYYVSMDPSILKSEAYDRGMDIVMFGHTHKPLIDLAVGFAHKPGHAVGDMLRRNLELATDMMLAKFL